MADKKLEKLSGLWLNKTKSGDTYFSGESDGVKYVIFKNGFKNKENQPDYVLYKEPKESKDLPF